MHLQEVLDHFNLLSASQLSSFPVSGVPNITSVRDISENTQNSVDVMTELENYLTKIGTSFVVNTDGTHIHDQKRTNLCHSYSTISGLKQLMRKFLENEVSDISARKLVLKSMNERGDCSFNRMLSVFVSCVSPRTFEDLFNVSFI